MGVAWIWEGTDKGMVSRRVFWLSECERVGRLLPWGSRRKLTPPFYFPASSTLLVARFLPHTLLCVPDTFTYS